MKPQIVMPTPCAAAVWIQYGRAVPKVWSSGLVLGPLLWMLKR